MNEQEVRSTAMQYAMRLLELDEDWQMKPNRIERIDRLVTAAERIEAYIQYGK